MIRWGVFTNKEENLQHVIPCAEEGEILAPHDASKTCKCGHSLKEGLVIHRDPERGGPGE